MNQEPHATLPSLRALLVLLACLFLASCAGTTSRQPSPGMALVDATPDTQYRDRVDDIRISALNGKAVRGTELKLPPGKTKMRVGFDWPQGGDQEVDLDFNAKPNVKYIVRYDVHPPYTSRLSQGGILDDTAGAIFGTASGSVVDIFLTIPASVAVGTAAMATRAKNEISEHSRAANYVDVMVVAQHSSQGVVCNRRVYPDGRIMKR